MKIKNPACPACLLHSTSLFKNLNEDDLLSLSMNKITNFYKKGQVVFYEGRIPAGIYCLQQGKVKIFKMGIDGKEQIVRIITLGGLLGIRSLVSGRNYSASAASLEDSVICFINKSFFLQLTEKYPEINNGITSHLCNMLAEAEDKITSMAQKPVRDRLAETLLILNRIFIPDGETHLNYDISLPREDLANIVGTATETIIRLLSELRDEKLININGRIITLIDIQGLKKLAKIF